MADSQPRMTLTPFGIKSDPSLRCLAGTTLPSSPGLRPATRQRSSSCGGSENDRRTYGTVDVSGMCCLCWPGSAHRYNCLDAMEESGAEMIEEHGTNAYEYLAALGTRYRGGDCLCGFNPRSALLV